MVIVKYFFSNFYSFFIFYIFLEFQGLNLSDSGDGDTLGPLPPGGVWGSDGEYSVPPYDYFQNRSNHNTGSSESHDTSALCMVVFERTL